MQQPRSAHEGERRRESRTLQELGGKIVAESAGAALPARLGHAQEPQSRTGTDPMVAMLHLAPSDRCPS
jgi:hypothetical protein